jgi:cytidylate kinase
MIVAIDGPAGAGKSTISRLRAERFGWTYLDTGALYRAVTLLALEQGIPPGDGPELGALARNAEIGFQPGPGGMPRVFAGCREVTEEVRSREVSAAVSEVSAHREVREALLEKQRECAAGEDNNVIVDGRDIGTVVFPAAKVKIFLTASISERSHRRLLELVAKGIDITPEQMEEDIKARDAYDSSREVAPLKKAPDAVVVDTTDMDIGQAVDAVAAEVERRRQI